MAGQVERLRVAQLRRDKRAGKLRRFLTRSDPVIRVVDGARFERRTA